MTAESPIHATCVARHGRGGWRAVLIAGPSGAGKSDLALRLIAHGWRLVADDYTHVTADKGALYASAPATIEGRIEVRGVGIVAARTRPVARIILAVDCVPTAVERLPEPEFRRFQGLDLPLIRLDPREASAVEKVAAAFQTL